MHLRGEIDIYTATQLKDDLNDLVSEPNNEVIVDLKDVTYMDSTGLGTFVSALKHAETANTTMTLIRANDRLYRLFQVTGLNDVIDVHSEKKVMRLTEFEDWKSRRLNFNHVAISYAVFCFE